MSVVLRNFQDKERIFFEKAGYNVAELENERIIVEVTDEKIPLGLQCRKAKLNFMVRNILNHMLF